MRRLLLGSFALLSLSACSLIPDYHRPSPGVAGQWPAGPAALSAADTKGQTAADLGWSQFFTDPVSQSLIRLALDNNRDLRVAALNVRSAEAQYGVDRASLFPTINGTASFDRSVTPGDVYGTQGQTQNLREYSLGASAVSWELDLFGQIRSKARAQQETVFSEAETRTATQLTLIGEVVSEYLAWLADRESLAVAENTVKTEADSVRLTQLLLAHGDSTQLDVAQAEVTLHSAQASLAQYRRAVAQDMDELVLLVGAPLPVDLVRRMQAVNFSDEPPFPSLSAGVPSDLLTRRPDIRAAEDTLLSANANIGAARAAFFPSITLTANGGTASGSLANLFKAGQASWGFEPQITLPIFDAGSNLANLDIAKLQKQIDIANYQKAIQQAFHDVSDALAARATYGDQIAAQQALVAADQQNFDLSTMRFKAGVDAYLTVLVAEESLFSAKLTLISLQLDKQQNLVTLYKALGGGWKI